MTKNLPLRALASLALCLALSITATQATTKYYAVNTTPQAVYVGLFTVVGGTITDYKTRKVFKLGPSAGVIKQYAAFDLAAADNKGQQQFIFSNNLTDLETVLTTGQIPLDTRTIFMHEVGQKPVFEIGLNKKELQQRLFMTELKSEEKPKGAAVNEKTAEINVAKRKEDERLLRRSKRAQEEQARTHGGQVLHIVDEPQAAKPEPENAADEEIGGVMFHSGAQPKAEAQAQQVAPRKVMPVKSKRWSLF